MLYTCNYMCMDEEETLNIVIRVAFICHYLNVYTRLLLWSGTTHAHMYTSLKNEANYRLNADTNSVQLISGEISIDIHKCPHKPVADSDCRDCYFIQLPLFFFRLNFVNGLDKRLVFVVACGTIDIHDIRIRFARVRRKEPSLKLLGTSLNFAREYG